MEETHRRGSCTVSMGLAFLLVVVTCLPTTGPANAAGGQWEWQNPLSQGNGLIAVWGSSSSDVFAVGWSGTILHYDGSAWSAMSSGATTWLNGVWGSSGSDVFAVGRNGAILHYGEGSAQYVVFLPVILKHSRGP